MIVMKGRRGPCLSKEPVAIVRGDHFGQHHLDRHQTVKQSFMGQKNHPHAASAKDFENAISAELPDFFWII